MPAHAPLPSPVLVDPDLPPPRAWPAAPTLRDVFEFYRVDPTRRHSATCDRAYAQTVKLVEALFGQELPVAALDRAACRQILEVLRWVPAHYARRLPGFTLGQAVALSHRSNRRATLKPITINAYMSRLRGLLNIALAEELIARNPALKLKLPDPTREIDRRRPFSPDQLQRIFDAPLYRGCQNDDFGFARPGATRAKRGRFWAPLISLYAGLRLNEVLQLDLGDIQRLDGVDCFVVTACSESGSDDKRLKTRHSERIVPIHSTLKTIGFMDCVAERRAKGDIKLFAELTCSIHSGFYSSPFSKWFRRFLIHAGAEAPQTSFHSFRHNFRDGLRRGGVEAELALALGGWTPAGGMKGAWGARSYGSRFAERQLAAAVEMVAYPGLALGHLAGEVSPIERTGHIVLANGERRDRF